ncbi:MAG: tetratricopeptide repeat protein [Candidatus Hydrogenedentes bacterium]|nr:tetratricopeptide repeat protein [Candidatus Hydrogenedentota bacterium]
MLFGGESAESYYDEGVTASMKGNLTLAMRHFERAIHLEHNHIAARYQLAKCYARAGNADNAVELFRQVIRAKPNQVPPRVDLAFTLIEMGKIGEAEKLFKEVLHYKGDHGRAYIGLGQCALAAERWKEAMVLADLAIKNGGANFAALFLLGRAQRQSGIGEEAVGTFKQADALVQKLIESTPEAPEGYYLRGVLCLSQDKITDAMELFQSAENRANPEAFYSAYGLHFNRFDIQAQRGICLLRLGRRPEAEALGRSILEQTANHGVARQLVGEADRET